MFGMGTGGPSALETLTEAQISPRSLAFSSIDKRIKMCYNAYAIRSGNTFDIKDG